MTVECTKYTPCNKGVLPGFADLYIPKTGLEIYGCQLCLKNGKQWLNMPQREYTNGEGEKKYLSIVRFRERDVQDSFAKAAITAIEKKIREESQKIPARQQGHTEIQDDLPF
jgi:hypothetical protein